MSDFRKKQLGFTLLETMVVVLIVGIAAGFATPKIVGAMRAYRLNVAYRTIVDTVNRARTLAVSDNRQTGIALDPVGRRVGLVSYNADGTLNRIDYRSLPIDVGFQRPATGSVPTGVAAGTTVVSFPATAGVYRLNFSSQGMPANAFGTTESIFVGNGREYRALTVSSVGGLRAWVLDANNTWTLRH